MKSVIERMNETGAQKKAADFQTKMKMDYPFKKRYAEIRAWEFFNHPEVRGNCYVAVWSLLLGAGQMKCGTILTGCEP